jgi:lysyl-tRNA synthetase class II
MSAYMSNSQLSDDLIGQRQQRIDIIQKLRDQGIDPYPARSQKDQKNQAIHDSFDDFNGKS